MNTISPKVPKWLEIKKHLHTNIENIENIKLYTYGRQNNDSWEIGYDIEKRVVDPLCADVLDHLLNHQDKIPSSWKGKLVFFWGTIYKVEQKVPIVSAVKSINGIDKNESKSLVIDVEYVRFLFFNGGEWKSDFLSLDDEFGPTRVSAEHPSHFNLSFFIKRFVMWTTAMGRNILYMLQYQHIKSQSN